MVADETGAWVTDFEGIAEVTLFKGVLEKSLLPFIRTGSGFFTSDITTIDSGFCPEIDSETAGVFSFCVAGAGVSRWGVFVEALGTELKCGEGLGAAVDARRTSLFSSNGDVWS